VDSPDAFGSTLERESGQTDDAWASRLAAGVVSATDLPLVAETAGRRVGLAWGRIEPAAPETAHLFQMWVSPAHRRLGAGRVLVEAVIRWAREAGARNLLLAVTCGDTPAVRLYTRAGFVPDGEPEPIRPGASVLAQPMKLALDEAGKRDRTGGRGGIGR
jgi:ribosomal protein S18 acetylase RimI-like enzyme